MRASLAAVGAAIFLITFAPSPVAAATAEVHISGGAPDPAEITVDQGDTVTFFNDDQDPHQIYALGQPRGDPIAPGTGAEFGPFDTGGQRGTFAYRVDQNGPAGTVFVRAATTSTSTTATTLPAKSTSTTTASTTTSTSTTTTTTAATAAGIDSSIQVVNPPSTGKKGSSDVLAVLGFTLLATGLGAFVLVATRGRGGPD